MYSSLSPGRLLRWAAVAGAIAAVSVFAARPALAGGPTSVLLVAPSSGATASLYNTDKEYALLEQALGSDPAPEDGAPTAVSGPSHDGVTITWLVHDVSVWRTDYVASVDGNPWVLTRISSNGEIALDYPAIWHHAADPQLLLNLFGSLGVLEGTGISTSGEHGVSAPVVATPPADAGAPTEAGGPQLWLWLLPGLLAGVLIGVAGRPAVSLVLRARYRVQKAEPRQQLIDV